MTDISDMEWAAKETAAWLFEMRNFILDAMAPDGRPFGMLEATPRERLENYLAEFKGDPVKQAAWVNARAAEVAQLVATMGPQAQASIHPYNIAESMGIIYSARMEQALKREQEKFA